MPAPGKKRVGLVSLGCPKNEVDAEVMLGRLLDEGYELTADSSDADAIIVNTCGFIDAAKEESIEAILEASRVAAARPGTRVIVTGCLSQRYPKELAEEFPEVAAFVPLGQVGLLRAAIEGTGARLPAFPDPYGATFLDDASSRRVLTSSRGSAYLKISEGCDHVCSFCAIPSMRGRHRSRPADDIVREAETLARQGVREIVLVAQDSSAYGRDRGGGTLAGLLARLDVVPGVAWLRVMYAYPNTLDDATLDALATLPRACRYLDIPLQHASRRVLAAMRRGGSAGSLAALLDRARTRVPGLVLRSTFIVGFPGEEEEDVRELLDFTRDVAFDHLGVFTYSHQEGTSAHGLGDPVAPEVKDERRARLLEQQAGISRRLNAARVGTTVEVLVEGAHPESEHLLTGRWRGQAPGVDGSVILTDGECPPGEVSLVEIEEAHEYDLVGRIVGRP